MFKKKKKRKKSNVNDVHSSLFLGEGSLAPCRQHLSQSTGGVPTVPSPPSPHPTRHQFLSVYHLNFLFCSITSSYMFSLCFWDVYNRPVSEPPAHPPCSRQSFLKHKGDQLFPLFRVLLISLLP